jgi:two-component system, NarL family, response regulator DevR
VQRIRVMLVDDHEVVREGLKMVLELDDEIEVVGQAADGQQSVQSARLLSPDVVLMDVMMPGSIDGVAACREIRSAQPGTQVVMLTSSASQEAVEASIMAGASGYVLKNVGRQELLRCIKAVGRGESLLDPGVTRKVLDRMRGLIEAERQREGEALSARENEVLALVAQGFTNKEIAQELVISEHTARNHVIRILDKLQVSRRSEAAAYAARHGMAPREERERG